MKKALVVLLALTCMSAAAFAAEMGDVAWTWSTNINTGAQIILGDSTTVPDATIEVRNADDPDLSQIRLNFGASMGDYALNARIATNLAGADDGVAFDLWWVTAKWMDSMVQLRVGHMDNAVTDTVNKGWGGLNVTGAQVVVVPMSGLSIGMGVPLTTPAVPVATAFAGTRIGLAYTMTDLVTVKATYINVGGDSVSDIAAGIAILAVPNLTAQFEVYATDFGGDVSVPATPTGAIELFENASYAMGALVPGIELYQALWNDSALDMTMYFKPYVSYMVMDGLDVGASIKYTMNQSGGATSGLVVDPWVKFTLSSNAKIKIDAAYTIGDLDDTSVWTLPININFLWSY